MVWDPLKGKNNLTNQIQVNGSLGEILALLSKINRLLAWMFVLTWTSCNDSNCLNKNFKILLKKNTSQTLILLD